MSALRPRDSTPGRFLASLLVALALLLQGLGTGHTVPLPAGICHADPADPDQPPADRHDHTDCCLLCHENPILAAGHAAELPPPAVNPGPAARLLPEPASSAPRPAAFYVARAPPRA